MYLQEIYNTYNIWCSIFIQINILYRQAYWILQWTINFGNKFTSFPSLPVPGRNCEPQKFHKTYFYKLSGKEQKILILYPRSCVDHINTSCRKCHPKIMWRKNCRWGSLSNEEGNALMINWVKWWSKH